MSNLEQVLQDLKPKRPLLIVDADEVLLKFVEHLEHYFTGEGYTLRLTSFQLSGNIYNSQTNKPASPKEVKKLIGGFFDACVDTVPAVPGAADALANLSSRYQVAILTNVPHHCRDRREAALKELGFTYPVISNAGEKGPAMHQLHTAAAAQGIFVDDLPPQHASVAKHAPDVHRVHFIADQRLAALIGKADHAHVRIDKWQELEDHLTGLTL